MLHVDSGAAEDSEPQGGYAGWNKQDAKAELADGTATGDTCQEHAHERGPGNPPCPVEDGVAGQPLTSGAVFGLGGAADHLGEVVEVVTNGARNLVEDGNGRAQDEHEDRQHCGKDHIRIGNVLNALAHTGHRGQEECEGKNQHDADNHGIGGVIDDSGCLQAGLNLQGTQAQGAGGTEDGGEDGQDIDELAHRTVGVTLADERHEGLAQ